MGPKQVMINHKITKYKWLIGHVAHLRNYISNYISKWLYNNVDLEKKNLRELNGPLFEQTWISFTQGSFLKSYIDKAKLIMILGSVFQKGVEFGVS